MVITQIQNREQAQKFLAALKGLNEHEPTERPYAIHLLILANGLHQTEVNIILENLATIDQISGEYVAVHLLVEAVEVDVIERLSGLNKTHEEIKSLSLPQIEGLCKTDALNHMDLGDLQGKSLTSPSQMIARELDVVNQLPCLVAIDAFHVTADQELVVLPLPKTAAELSKQLNSLNDILLKLKGSHSNISRDLEDAHTLYQQVKELKGRRGAPRAEKQRRWSSLLQSITNEVKALKEFKRVEKKIGGNPQATGSQLSLLCATNALSLKNSDLIAPKDLLSNLQTNFIKISHDLESDSTAATLSKRISDFLVMQILESEEGLAQEIEKKSRELESIIDRFKNTPSICKEIRKSSRNASVRKFVSEATKKFFGSTVAECGKPSFWLKLFGFGK